MEKKLGLQTYIFSYSSIKVFMPLKLVCIKTEILQIFIEIYMACSTDNANTLDFTSGIYKLKYTIGHGATFFRSHLLIKQCRNTGKYMHNNYTYRVHQTCIVI